jgi:hypothetical protein
MTDDRDAADRAAYEATGNPLYIWFAIGCYAQGEPLPAWIRTYLIECMRELSRLMLDYTISPGEAQQQTARALGLVSQGRNRFAEARQKREDDFLATMYGLGARKGQSDSWAAKLATGTKADATLETKVRSVRRRVARARRTWPK